MTGLQKFREKMLFRKEPSDHERSIFLVDIMNTLGFSKNEREIHRHDIHLQIAILNIFGPADQLAITMTRSASEGMLGGIYGMESHHDSDFLLTDIKLYQVIHSTYKQY